MNNILTISIHELRLLSRDRHALALLFAMPLALILFLSLALKDVYQSKVGGLQDLHLITKQTCNDSTSLCGEFQEQLQRFHYSIKIEPELIQKSATLSLLLPSDLDNTLELLQSGEQLKPDQQLQIIFDPTLDQSARELVKSHVYLSLQSIIIKRFQNEVAKQSAEVKFPDITRFEGLVTEKALGGLELPNPIQQSVPAWTLFGMFFIVIPLTNSMIRDRQLGIFKRLLSFPITRTELFIGKMLPYFFITVFQFVLMFAMGLLILPKLLKVPTDLNINLVAIIAVTFASALAANAYGLMISSFAKTSEQAHAFGALSVVILSIIGGVMIPRFVMPEFMQTVAKISPLYWGLESYLDIIVRKSNLLEVLPKISFLILFSICAGFISRLKFNWNEVN